MLTIDKVLSNIFEYSVEMLDELSPLPWILNCYTPA